MNLAGKSVLVTGATGGIGQAVCHQLAEQGAKLILLSRSEQKLKQLCSSLPRSHEHQVLAVDISSEEGLETLTIFANQRFDESEGAIDVVVNNAGTNRFCLLSERHDQDIRDEITLNLITPILITKMSLNWLNPPELILNIGSTFAAIGYPGYSTYCSAKSGLYRFTEAMNRELNNGYDSSQRTKLLYLAPRATKTNLNSEQVSQMNVELGNASDTPEYVAKQVAHILEKESVSKWLGWPEKLFVRVNQIIPKVVTSAIAKQFPIIQRYLMAADTTTH
jgi:short-subunit dehydrogenase